MSIYIEEISEGKCHCQENCILLFVIDIINLNISKKIEGRKNYFKKVTLINDVICSSDSIMILLIKEI